MVRLNLSQLLFPHKRLIHHVLRSEAGVERLGWCFSSFYNLHMIEFFWLRCSIFSGYTEFTWFFLLVENRI